MRTVVTFRSTAFNTVDEKPYFINPACFGDDVARWLIERFRTAEAALADDPGQEDFGWYFNFQTRDTPPHTCVIGLRPSDSGEAPVWVVWVERKRGLVSSILGGRRRRISPSATALLHGVLSSAREISDIHWYEQDDYDSGREVSAGLTR